MASDNEVFFVDSSASEGEEEDDYHHHRHQDRHGRVNSGSEASTPAHQPLATPSPTMEDLFFRLAPPKRHLTATPPPLAFAPNQSSPLVAASPFDATQMGSTTTSSVTVSGSGPQLVEQADFPYAGGSPCAMPVAQLPPTPRSLAELRGMTSSEVREELERFFVRKDALVKRFSAAEAQLQASQEASVEKAASSRSTVLARDRCRRLVNVSNWGAAVNGYSQWDVLLPSALLPDVSSTEQGAPAAGPMRRTLRPHQIEGIRFLWSVLAEGPVGQVPAVGCILAHTMGLGKTGQVVVFLHLFMAAFQRRVDSKNSAAGTSASRASPCPSPSAARLPRALIAIPKSTQSGWKREFDTWSLCFPEPYRLHPLYIEEGRNARQRVEVFHKWRHEGGVLLIGYEALVRLMQLVEADSVVAAPPRRATEPAQRSDHTTAAAAREQHRRDLRERRTDEGGTAYGGDDDPFTELVVCDEAHRLKSVHLHVVQALRGLHPLRRMLLTGTPLQNHLHEYWAMMDFCVHKYFSRRRFREYFIQPIESSASTRASEKEVDLARKKTFTLINEVRHFVQRVDSTPLRNELPPLHEYVVVLPPSQLQKELYLRFIQIVQHDGSQKLQFLPAVSYSGKIAAHPQLLFQMRDRITEAAANNNSHSHSTSAGRNGSRSMAGNKRVSDHRALKKKSQQQQRPPPAQPPAKRQRSSDDDEAREADSNNRSSGGNDDGEDKTSSSSGDSTDAIVVSDSDGSLEEAKAVKEEEEFARVTQQSFSSRYPAPLTYEELCIPPSPAYVPQLEEGVKLYTAMKLIVAAMAQREKVLLFSLSTQLLTFFELMVAKVNAEWRQRPGSGGDGLAGALPHPLLQQPIRYCRLDGNHTAAQRAAMLDEFDREDGPDLFLLSMKAGGVGVTITAATRVILVDTSFNPADDQQAIGRAYRYGQTRPVFVYRLMCYPTLEYSIFVQKLAKEWLFKTVVEETSVKRDGLSGMHLKELFSLLTRAAKVLAKPPAATRAQAQTTKDVLDDDPLLSVVQSDLLYAQRYEMFLEQDQNDQYGVAEEEFYRDYCRNRLFSTADDEDAERQAEARRRQQQQQRRDDAAQLQSQSKTLMSMVDDLIRSRAGTDPQLARLLSAMGLHIDPDSGRMQTRSSAVAPPPSLEQSDEHFAPSPVVLVGGGGSHNGGVPRPPRSPRLHDSRQTAVLLLDSDDDDDDKSNNAGQRNGVGGDEGGTRTSVDTANRIAASLARQPYARYRPGGSPSRAVEIDSDVSQ